MEDPTPKPRAALRSPDVREPDIKLWDALPNEPRDAFGFFCLFRDMAYPNGYHSRWSRRSVSELARRHQIRHETIFDWSREWRWRERVLDFDLFLDHAATEGLINEAVQAKRRALRRMQKLGEYGEVELERHMKRAELLNDNPNVVVPTTRTSDVLEILDRVTKTELVLLEGVAPESNKPETKDLSHLSVADLKKIAELRKKIDPK